jgi:hypothetical protein
MRCFNFAILILSTLILGISCATNKDKQTSVLKYDTTKIAILEYPKSKLWIANNPKPFALVQSDIYTIDNTLKKAIVAYNIEISDVNKRHGRKFTLLDEDTKGLRRQYIPYVDENGQKIALVNCFCSDNENWKDWNKTITSNGGKCFYSLRINLETKKFDYPEPSIEYREQSVSSNK